MGNHVLRTGLAVAALAAASTLTWASGTPLAHAEPECTNGSNDFDGNGYPDLAVGIPGANGARGAVEVHMMDDDEPRTVRIEAPNAQSGDQFGASVAEVAYYEDELDTSTCSQLVVGAPSRDVGDQEEAGAVFLYRWDGGEKTFVLVKELVQGKDGVPGKPQAEAGFGTSLAAPYHEPDIGDLVTPLYVGAPGTTVGGASRAGSVTAIRLTGGSGNPHVGKGTVLAQGTGSVPGTSEVGDSFGQALAATPNGVLVGVPGENDSAGGFVRWRENDSGKARFLTQNSAGVPGTSEPGDDFGAALYSAVETMPAGGGPFTVMVGAPGEAIGKVKQAGSAIKFTYDGDLRGKAKGYNQDTAGVAGHPETGDRFGSSFGSFGPSHLLVGAPGEAIGSVARAGMVQSLTRNQSWSQNTAGVSGTAERDDRFGATIGNALVPMTGERDDGWLSRIVIGVPGENDDSGMMQVGLPGGSGSPYGYFSAEVGDRYATALGKTD